MIGVLPADEPESGTDPVQGRKFERVRVHPAFGGHDQFNGPLLSGDADPGFRAGAGLRASLLAPVDPEQVTIAYDGVVVCEQGIAAAHDVDAVTKAMEQRDLVIDCDLHNGNGEATMLFTDLTHAYVDENMGTS